MQRHIDNIRHQDTTIADHKQQILVLEDQLQKAQEELQVLETSLDQYKHKYSQSSSQVRCVVGQGANCIWVCRKQNKVLSVVQLGVTLLKKSFHNRTSSGFTAVGSFCCKFRLRYLSNFMCE